MSLERRIHRTGVMVLSSLVVLALGDAEPLRAQALNNEIVRLLDRNCSDLLGPNYTGNFFTDFGPNLAAFCSAGPGPGQNGSATGGGTGSVQSSTAQIRNSILQRRLERARKEQRGRESAETSRLFWNVYNDESDALLYAASPADGTTPSGDAEPGIQTRRFSFYTSGTLEKLERDVTSFEDGYDSSIIGLTLGADYRFTDAFVAGVVATSSRQDGDFDGGGDFEIRSLAPILYASIVPSERTFIQLVAGVTGEDFEVNRQLLFVVEDSSDPNIMRELSGVTSSESDGSVLNGGAQFGYDRSVGQFTYGPRVGLNYSKTTVDAIDETGGTGLELRVDKLSVKSLQGVFGFYGSMALSGKSGVFLPQINVEYVHEFEDSPSLLSAEFAEDLRGPGAASFAYQTNVPDSGFFNAEIGVAAIFANGMQPYVNLRAMLGNTNLASISGTVGIRFEL